MLGARLSVLCLLWLALMFVARQIRQEWRVEQTEKARMSWSEADSYLSRDPASLAPRAALGLSLKLAKAASVQADATTRLAQLKLSRELLGQAVQARPRWGEAAVVDAYLSHLQWGATDRRTLRAFSRSLKEAPYLKTSANWRIRFGALSWAHLDPQTRAHIVNEARWVAKNARSDALRVKTLLGSGEASRAFYGPVGTKAGAVPEKKAPQRPF